MSPFEGEAVENNTVVATYTAATPPMVRMAPPRSRVLALALACLGSAGLAQASLPAASGRMRSTLALRGGGRVYHTLAPDPASIPAILCHPSPRQCSRPRHALLAVPGATLTQMPSRHRAGTTGWRERRASRRFGMPQWRAPDACRGSWHRAEKSGGGRKLKNTRAHTRIRSSPHARIRTLMRGFVCVRVCVFVWPRLAVRQRSLDDRWKETMGASMAPIHQAGQRGTGRTRMGRRTGLSRRRRVFDSASASPVATAGCVNVCVCMYALAHCVCVGR